MESIDSIIGQIRYNQCEYAVVDVSDNSTTVFDGPCILYGLYVNTILSNHALPIQDGSTTVVTVVAQAAVGTNILFPGISFGTSLVVNPNDAATGNVTVAFRRINVATDIPL